MDKTQGHINTWCAKVLGLCSLFIVLFSAHISATKCADALQVQAAWSGRVQADTTWFGITVDKLPLTVVYYPDTAFGPLPTAYTQMTCEAEERTDMVRTMLFADCKMQYVFTMPEDLLTRLKTENPKTEVKVALCAYETANVMVVPTLPVIKVTGLALVPEQVTLSATHPKDTIRAKITPANADNKELEWVIIGEKDVDGKPLLTLGWGEDSAVVSMATPSRGGVVKLAATTKDGSELTDTAYITVPNTTKVESITLTATDAAGVVQQPAELSSTTKSLTIQAAVLPVYAADQSLTIVVTDQDGLATWDDKTSTLTVKENGEGGTITVTASANDGSGVSETLTITVKPTTIEATGIAVTPKTATLSTATPTQTFTATVSPANVKTQAVKWTLADNRDAYGNALVDTATTVPASCTVTLKEGAAGGVVKLAATTTDGTDKSDTAYITVPNTAKMTGITLTAVDASGVEQQPTELSNAVKSLIIRANVQPTYAANQDMVWAVIDTASLATWDEPTKTITVKENGNGGTIRIAATSKEDVQVTDTLIIKVLPTPILVTSIAITPTLAHLSDTQLSETFVVTIAPAEARNKTIVWELLDNKDVQGNPIVDTVTTQATVTAAPSCVVTLREGNAGGLVRLLVKTTDGSNLSAVAQIQAAQYVTSMTMILETADNRYELEAVDSVYVRAVFTPSFLQPNFLSYKLMSGHGLVELTNEYDAVKGMKVVTKPDNKGGEAVIAGVATMGSNEVTAELTLVVRAAYSGMDDAEMSAAGPSRRLVMYDGRVYVEVKTDGKTIYYNLQGQVVTK